MSGSSRDAHIEHRAERAFRYCILAARYGPDCPQDAISDLMHYAAQYGDDPFEVVALAVEHYRAETHDTGDGTNEDGDAIVGRATPHECGAMCPGGSA